MAAAVQARWPMSKAGQCDLQQLGAASSRLHLAAVRDAHLCPKSVPSLRLLNLQLIMQPNLLAGTLLPRLEAERRPARRRHNSAPGLCGTPSRHGAALWSFLRSRRPVGIGAWAPEARRGAGGEATPTSLHRAPELL